MKYAISIMLFIVLAIGYATTILTFQACSAPLIKVQITQKLNTQSNEDSTIIDSELQSSEKNKSFLPKEKKLNPLEKTVETIKNRIYK